MGGSNGVGPIWVGSSRYPDETDPEGLRMAQRDLFTTPRARRSDPLSSHAAADKMERSGKLNRQCDQVLEAVREHPGSTSRELHALTGLDRHMVARRLPDLEKRGLVGRTVVGSKAVRWWAGTCNHTEG